MRAGDAVGRYGERVAVAHLEADGKAYYVSTGQQYRADHPVVVGYDGSASSRNALAYAAGVSRRLGRPLLVAYQLLLRGDSTGRYSRPAYAVASSGTRPIAPPTLGETARTWAEKVERSASID